VRFDISHTLANAGLTKSWPELLDETRRRAELADEVGIDGMWFGEHHFDRGGFDQLPNPVLLAADLAGRTSRLRLGMAAVTLTLWDPHRLAEDLAMLDRFSGGRVDVAFSRGILSGEILNINPDADRANEAQSRAIFAANLDVVKQVWATDPPQPVQSPTPPIYAVSENATGFRLAAQQGLGAITAFPSGKVLANMRRAYFEEAERVGLAPALRRSTVSKTCCVAETDAEARRLVEKDVLGLFELIKQVRGLQAWLDEDEDPDDPALNAMNGFDLMLERDHLMVGSPESVAARMIRLADTHGLDHFLLGMGKLDEAVAERSIRLLAEEVAPAVRRAVDAKTSIGVTT